MDVPISQIQIKRKHVGVSSRFRFTVDLVQCIRSLERIAVLKARVGVRGVAPQCPISVRIATVVVVSKSLIGKVGIGPGVSVWGLASPVHTGTTTPGPGLASSIVRAVSSERLVASQGSWEWCGLSRRSRRRFRSRSRSRFRSRSRGRLRSWRRQRDTLGWGRSRGRYERSRTLTGGIAPLHVIYNARALPILTSTTDCIAPLQAAVRSSEAK